MVKINEYDFPGDLWYHPQEHLWLRPERQEDACLVTVGIDAFGLDALGEVVYLELMEAGRAVTRGEAVGSLEAEKMVRPLIAPVSGILYEVNGAVLLTPSLMNLDPYGQGWLFRTLAKTWETEKGDLLHGDEVVTAWVQAEIISMQEGR